jgi:phosphoribosylamine--glycine ligase
MRILLLGSGGREHAIAFGIMKSPGLEKLYVAPGNGGIETLDERCQCVEIDIMNPGSVAQFVKQQRIDFTVVGPEAPLAAGVVNALHAANHLVFGPTEQAAELEISKAAAKAFMKRWHLPTADSRTFCDYEQASAFINDAPWSVVIKASGLAAGKGVVLPNSTEQAQTTLRDMMLNSAFGDAGQTVVIEERISGPEVSLLCFSDGERIAVMPTARDHKRLLEDDLGPNTGGMGAFAPVPGITQTDIDIWSKTILQPAIAGLRAEGRPYVGVLYAGLMLTSKGPKLLEFNCRFGDPEAQVLLPLLESDLLSVMLDCAQGQMNPASVIWKTKSAATVVLASGGYPRQYETGFPISGIDAVNALETCRVYQAGTRVQENEILTSGGRVLCVTALGDDLKLALQNAYKGVAKIQFSGAQYRRDIGQRSLSKGHR